MTQKPKISEQDLVFAPGGPKPRDAVHEVPVGAQVLDQPAGAPRVVAGAATGLVLTPGGYREAGLVTQLEPGSVIDLHEGRLRTLGADGKLLADHGPLLVRAAGRPVQPLNLRTVAEPGPAGAQVVQPAFGTGWITYAYWNNATGTPISRFSTTWTVPAEPQTADGQLIYLFNGIQNSTMILQPVLQWGNNNAFGGNYWCLSCWYADGQGGQAFHTAPVRVNPGDVLTGVMAMTGTSGTQHSYSCTFSGIANTTLNISNAEELTWCAQSLEAYSITAASDYPHAFDTAMTAIDISTGSTHPALTWTRVNAITDTGQHTVVVSNHNPGGEVDLCYRATGLISPTVPGHAEVTPVVRSANHLDVFVTDAGGRIMTAAWQPDFADWWHGWWHINSGYAAPGAPAHAVSRSADKLDVFVTGTDKHIWSAAWQPEFVDWFHGWWQLLGQVASPGAHVTAASRSKDKLDIFVVGSDGHVYTAAWDAAVAGGWRGWWRIGDVVAPQGAPVHVVSRSTDKLDIFVSDTQGRVMSAAWEPAFGSSWHGWWHINNGYTSAPGAPVTAVSRGHDKLDIFTVGTDSRVWTAAWDAAVAGGWRGWWQVGTLVAPHGAPVYAVSRSTDKLDIFATDSQGRVMSAAWEPAFGSSWHGWWHINNGYAAPGAPVTAASRSTDKLDIFVVGTDSKVWTAAWDAAVPGGWHGWWVMGA